MMRGFVFSVCTALCFVACGHVLANGSASIERFLNARPAGSTRLYSEAVATLKEAAAKGKTLQQYLLALNPSEDPEIRLDAETQVQYLQVARPKIAALARRTRNALAIYLIALDVQSHAEAEAEGRSVLSVVDAQRLEHVASRAQLADALLRAAALAGNVQALNALGMQELARKSGLAVECFKRAAAMGDANAFYNLGACYAQGLGGAPRDGNQAVGAYLRAAEANHAVAMNNLGFLLQHGIFVPKDVERAAAWYERSARLGNPEGNLNYATCLVRGMGVPVNAPRAESILTTLQRYPATASAASIQLAILARDGIGCDVDMARAIAYLVRPARSGDVTAQLFLAQLLEDADETVAPEEKAPVLTDDAQVTPGSAAYWYARAAANGNRRAMNALGTCYYKGRGAPKNYDSAYRCFSLASVKPETSTATEGYGTALNNVGLCYLRGHGVKRNVDKAYQAFAQASEVGDAEATYNLAHMTLAGSGCAPSRTNAVKLFKLAAKMGKIEAAEWLSHHGY